MIQFPGAGIISSKASSGGGGGSGTVTSVSATVPAALLSVSGVPITTAGTIAIALVTQTANTIFAGPTSGGAATPTFRALVNADIPTTLTPQVTRLGIGGAADAANLLQITGGTVTVSTPVISATQTWNAGAIAFTGILLSVTNTTSASASLLIDLQVGATSMFKVTRGGAGTFTSVLTASQANITNSCNALLYNATTGTITSSSPALAATQTWNSGGVTFKGITLTITDTASAAASLFADFLVGAVSRTSFGKSGFLTINANAAAPPTAAVGALIQLTQADSTAGRVELNVFASSGLYSVRRTNGTNASPSALVANDQIGGFNFHGFGATVYVGPSASLQGFADGTWTDSSAPSYLVLGTTPAASTTLVERFRVLSTGGIQIPAGTMTTAIPAVSITQTWNAGGVAFTSLLLNVTNTASAAASLLIDAQVASATVFNVGKAGNTTVTMNALATTVTTGLLLTNTTAAISGTQQYSPALRLLGNGFKTDAVTASQTTEFRMYVLPVQAAGNPTAQLIFEYAVNGGAFTQVMSITSAGALNVPATIASTSNSISAAQGGRLQWNTRCILTSPADGTITLLNNAQNAFTQLQFGGTTSSFPSLKRVTTTLSVRLADDSADAGLLCGAFTASGNLSFFAAAAASQRTSGANLTNNVTAGGTDDTIANFTDLTVYANDSAAIRNDIYQLSRKLKQINDGLRTYGLFT